ncbi:MAG: hypothetical protein JXB34_01940 [Bacteroidales bacterium]|nr:hypothetical protein [Bacteroidales bacterium]
MKKTKKLWLFIVAFFVVNLTIVTTKMGGDRFLQYVSDLFPVLCSLVAVIALFDSLRSFKLFDFTKKAWIFILVGMIFYFVAESVYALLDLAMGYDMNETFPSVADIFWCTGYIPLLWGLLMMFTGYAKSGLPMGSTKLYFVIGAIIMGVTAFVVYYVLMPISADPETSGLQFVFSMFYPIADVLVVIPALVLMYITSLFGKGTISRPWKYLALGFLLFTVADLLYSYMLWQDLYDSGSYIDIAWNLGYLFIALAALYQKELVESVKGKA